MTWVKLDDHVAYNDKVLRAGPVAFAIWVAALGYCNAQHTDGRVPQHVLASLFPSDDITKVGRKRAIAKLVDVGLWRSTASGYEVVNYARYQGAALREHHDAQKAKDAERKRVSRLRLVQTSPKLSKNPKTVSNDNAHLEPLSALSRSRSLSPSEKEDAEHSAGARVHEVPPPNIAPTGGPRPFTAHVLRARFTEAFEAACHTTPNLYGTGVGQFAAEVLRTAELQRRDPRELLGEALTKFFSRGLTATERQFPYACFHAAWSALTNPTPVRPSEPRKTQPGRFRPATRIGSTPDEFANELPFEVQRQRAMEYARLHG